MLSVNAGVRADKTVDVKLEVGGEISKDALQSLGIRTGRNVGTKVVGAMVSDHSLCGSSTTGEQRSLKVHAPRGTSVPVYLNITTSRRLKDDEYAVIRVVETEGDRLLGGVSVVVVEGQTKPGGAQ
jgi:hypothetical protein